MLSGTFGRPRRTIAPPYVACGDEVPPGRGLNTVAERARAARESSNKLRNILPDFGRRSWSPERLVGICSAWLRSLGFVRVARLSALVWMCGRVA